VLLGSLLSYGAMKAKKVVWKALWAAEEVVDLLRRLAWIGRLRSRTAAMMHMIGEGNSHFIWKVGIWTVGSGDRHTPSALWLVY